MAKAETESKRKPSMRDKIVAVLTSWHMAISLIYGFVCGIPLALTMATPQAWMVDEKIDLTTIGLFSLVGLPYTLKFLWSPLLDRYPAPILTRLFGRRRGWILFWQAAIAAAIIGMAFCHPGAHPVVFAFFALLLAFCSASHDIVNDAYRIELLSAEEYALGSSLYVMGYRLSMYVSGAGALAIAYFFQQHLDDKSLAWRWTYLIMASTMLIGLVTTLLAVEPKANPRSPHSLKEAVVQPLLQYFSRVGALEILAFLIIYKLDTNFTIAMTTPFMMGIGFTKLDIALVVKGFGTFALIAGTLIAGITMINFSLRRSLVIFGVLQAFAGLTYMALAKAGHNYPLMVASITAENFFSGMGLAALNAFMMAMVDKRYTATQYALITSFMALSRYVTGAPSGWMAEHLGWPSYYLVCALAAIPGLLLLLRYKRWELPGTKAA